jgi:hypothetical protein
MNRGQELIPRAFVLARLSLFEVNNLQEKAEILIINGQTRISESETIQKATGRCPGGVSRRSGSTRTRIIQKILVSTLQVFRELKKGRLGMDELEGKEQQEHPG